MVIVRENMEDTYVGVEGDLEDLSAINFVSRLHRQPVADMGKGKYAMKVITEACTQDITRFACELALTRSAESGRAPHVTSGTKHNISPVADGYFREIAMETAKEYPDVKFDTLLADDMVHKIIVNPQAFNVILLPNLYGDLFSDAAGGVIGGLGLAPSGCYGKDYAYFESAHGSAPDIMGQDIINPTATIFSAAMMLEYLGYLNQAKQLVAAVEQVYAAGKSLTPDQGGKASTTEFCEAVAKYLR